MDPHVGGDQFERYQAGQMTPSEIVALREHLDSCAPCRAQYGQAVENARLLAAWIDPEPDEQELVLFVANRLPGDRAAEIEAHLGTCDDCRDAVADLRAVASPPVVEMPARRWPVPLWWGGFAAAVLVGVYFLIPHQPAPKLIASLHDSGGDITLDAAGHISGVGADGPQGWLASALQTGVLRTEIAAPAGSRSILRGEAGNATFRVLAPVGLRALDDRPLFRWEALSGSSSYRVTVFTEDEQIVAETTTSATQWQPAASLPRSVTLGWQVTAARGGQRIVAPAPPEPRAYFDIATDQMRQRIEREKTAAQPSHLRLAVEYARDGMPALALQELDALDALNPGSDLVRRLRASLVK